MTRRVSQLITAKRRAEGIPWRSLTMPRNAEFSSQSLGRKGVGVSVMKKAPRDAGPF